MKESFLISKFSDLHKSRQGLEDDFYSLYTEYQNITISTWHQTQISCSQSHVVEISEELLSSEID